MNFLANSLIVSFCQIKNKLEWILQETKFLFKNPPYAYLRGEVNFSKTTQCEKFFRFSVMKGNQKLFQERLTFRPKHIYLWLEIHEALDIDTKTESKKTNKNAGFALVDQWKELKKTRCLLCSLEPSQIKKCKAKRVVMNQTNNKNLALKGAFSILKLYISVPCIYVYI